MPRRLGFSLKALADLAEIRAWLTQPGAGIIGRKRLTTLRAALSGLIRTPCLFPVGDTPGTRERPTAGGFRIIYQLDPDTRHNETAGDVEVIRIFGPGQVRELK